MIKAYSRITWKNDPSTDTPLNETNLNKMDLAINVIDDRVCNMDDSVSAKATLAESYAKGGTGSRQGENTDNAKYYMEQAQAAGARGIEAKSYAVGGTGSRTGEDTDNAKYYKEQAAISASQAQAVVGIGIATTSRAGIVKPDGTTVTVDADGTIHSVGGSGTPSWDDITGKPSTFTPSSHTHAKSEVGLANVDNTADANKTVNKALLASGTDVTSAQLRNVVFTQTAPTVGASSSYAIGTIIAVYE